MKKILAKILPTTTIMMSVLAPASLPGLHGIATAATTAPQVVQDKCNNLIGSIAANISTFGLTDNGNNTYTCTFPSDTEKPNTTIFDPGGNILSGGQINIQGAGTLNQGAGGKLSMAPTSCAGTLSVLTSPFICAGRALMALIGASLISATAWLLGVSGILFNWIVTNTVVQFGSQIYNQVESGIIQAWTAFRDIANILIIGIFVFVAIGIILGLKEYGKKSYIANILIVAVLINFSLLFSQMVIDFSNFTATQFYNATASQAITGQAAGVNQTDQQATNGLAGTFTRLTGVQTIGGGFTELYKIAEKNDSGSLALLHGLVIATFYLLTALVFLYGSYVLIVRAILLIFVMLTSSIAFATYIIPNQTFVKKGWTAWWGALLKSAVLAPLLMVFLWVTALVATALSDKLNLGGLTSDTPTITSVQNLFNYFIVLGLLFASFKIANSLANSISGFSMPLSIVRNVAGAAVGGAGLVSRFAIAPALQRTVGRAAARREEEQGVRAKSSRDMLGASTANVDRLRSITKRTPDEDRELRESEQEVRRLSRETAGLERSSARAGRRAASKLNVFDTAPAKALTKGLGLKGALTGQSASGALGYAGRIDRDAKAAAKIAERFAPSEDDRNKLGDKLVEESRIRDERERAERNRLAKDAQVRASTQFQGLSTSITAAMQAQATHENNNVTGKTALTNAVTGLNQARAALGNRGGYRDARDQIGRDALSKQRINADSETKLRALLERAGAVLDPNEARDIATKHRSAVDEAAQQAGTIVAGGATAINNALQQAANQVAAQYSLRESTLQGQLQRAQAAGNQDEVARLTYATTALAQEKDRDTEYARGNAIRAQIVDADPERREAIEKELATAEEQRANATHVSMVHSIRTAAQNLPEEEQKVLIQQVNSAGSERASNLRHQAENIMRAAQTARRIESEDNAVQQAQAAYSTAQLSLNADPALAAARQQRIGLMDQISAVQDEVNTEMDKIADLNDQTKIKERENEIRKQAGAALIAGAARAANWLGRTGVDTVPKVFDRERRGKKVEEAFIKKHTPKSIVATLTDLVQNQNGGGTP